MLDGSRPAARAKETLSHLEIANDLDFLLQCLSERWPSVRRFAAERLKVLRDARAVPGLLAASRDTLLLLSGSGDIIEPDEPVIAIGSGGNYALSAARALIAHSDLDAPSIARESLRIAASICLYTNDQIVIEELT